MADIIINGSFLGKRTTGVQRYAKEISFRLLEDYPDFKLATSDYSLKKKYSDSCLLVERGLVSQLFGNKAWTMIDLPSELKAMGRPVLWNPSNLGPPTYANNVITIHDMATFDHPEFFKRSFTAIHKFFLPRAAASAKKIITISNFSKDRISQNLRIDPSKIEVVYNGVDPFFHPRDLVTVKEVKTKYNLDKPFLLTTSTLEPRKNLTSLVEAWSRLPKQVSENFDLVITGAKVNSFRETGVEEQVRSSDNIKLLGYVPDDDLPSLYTGAEYFVYPSVYEGFGLPPLEAMACGTQAIISNVTALPEIFGDYAFYFDPHNIDSITERIRETLERNGEKDITGISEKYSWERATSNISAILKSI